jgi:MoxR-like ATPase
MDVDALRANAQRILDSINSVVLGKESVARLCVIALIAGEHVLLEDVPGVGKTLMAKAIARSIDANFSRVQFTPDLLPSDILGSSVFNSEENSFVFNYGAVFSNFVLADEINRAPPRTQSALLEAMSESQISVDGTTYELPNPFMVIATQNPFEFEGTYVLPESQLDRFLMRLSMGYPDREYESGILASHKSGDPLENLAPVCGVEDIVQIRTAVGEVTVEDSLVKYMMDVVNATREGGDISVGVSTRGALAWYRATQAMAFLDGRTFVIPDDARALALHVLPHRIQLRGGFQGARREESEAAIVEILAKLSLPS